ncbi:MAG: DUF485 domain-containing protein [Candidatus Marinimicrobia bacterium]|nr:DUF485 domain-containing protein [Candidatus Neomarinimicrobiota bacterium]
MLHGKATKNEVDHASKIKTKIGMWMFLLYTLVYAGFIIVTVVKPELMGTDIGYLNLAIVYGMGLIVFALILALIYNALCSKFEKKLNIIDETSVGGAE